MKDDRPRALAVLVAVFLIGILLGVAGSHFWLKSSTDMSRSLNRKSPLPSNGQPLEIPEFHLTSEQEQKLRKIWKETGEKLRALMEEQSELMAEGEKKKENIWVENDRRVRAELNEEQKAIFDPWIEKFRNWRARSPRRMGSEPPKENRRKPERR